MALIQKRKDGNYYIVYRDEDGHQVWLSTATDNKADAQAAHDLKLQAIKQERARRTIAKLLGEPVPQKQSIARESKKRIKLSDIITTAEKYKDISLDKKRAWSRFVETLSKDIRYADQITADIAFSYLNKHYGGQKGKTWNNNRTYLNSIFRIILVDAGIMESPFQRIIQKRIDDGDHQRPFTEDECTAIIGAAKEPWRSAAIIAYYTGLRQIDCFALKWSSIQDGIITHMPEKTRRYNRAVKIPIHEELQKYLDTLPHKTDTVVGFTGSRKGRFTSYFGELLDELKITDNENGTVEFNCFRNTFITRCRAAGIPEHVIRGIVGHVSSDMTDLYSHDTTGAMEILKMSKGNF